MGRESATKRYRTCVTCQKDIFGDATSIHNHQIMCKRLQILGMISPDFIRPENQIIIPGGEGG